MRCSDPTRCGCSRCSADTALLAELAPEWREPDEVALFAEIEKFCGGKGGKPGPCPKGRSKAHETMRIHATAAAKQAQTAADKLAKEHARHAKHRPGTKSHAAASTRLAAAAGEHLKATLKADRLGRKARALEHQHQVGQKVKEAAKAKREAGKPAAKSAAAGAGKPAGSKQDAAVRDRIREMAPEIEGQIYQGAMASLKDLRETMSNVPKEQFDKAILDMASKGEITLTRDNFTATATPEEKAQRVSDGKGNHFIGFGLREGTRFAPPESAGKKKPEKPVPGKPVEPTAPDKSAPWHGNREDVFAAMRKLGDQNEHNWEQAKKLGPRSGTLSIGTADFDHVLKAEVGDQYLRSLRQGKTPDEAHAAAAKAGDETVRKWNTQGVKGRVSISGKHQLQRWEGAGTAAAEDVHRRFQASMPSDTPAPTKPPEKPAVPDEHISHVLAAVKAHDRGANLAPLDKVREHLASKGISDRTQQDAAINEARKQGQVTGSGLEGRNRPSAEHLAAAIPEEGGNKIGYLSTRQGSGASTGGSKQPTGNPVGRPKGSGAVQPETPAEKPASAHPLAGADPKRIEGALYQATQLPGSMGGGFGGTAGNLETHMALANKFPGLTHEQTGALLNHLEDTGAIRGMESNGRGKNATSAHDKTAIYSQKTAGGRDTSNPKDVFEPTRQAKADPSILRRAIESHIANVSGETSGAAQTPATSAPAAPAKSAAPPVTKQHVQAADAEVERLAGQSRDPENDPVVKAAQEKYDRISAAYKAQSAAAPSEPAAKPAPAASKQPAGNGVNQSLVGEHVAHLHGLTQESLKRDLSGHEIQGALDKLQGQSVPHLQAVAHGLDQAEHKASGNAGGRYFPPSLPKTKSGLLGHLKGKLTDASAGRDSIQVSERGEPYRRFSDGIDALLYELFAEHDVSGEARDADGEWTTGGAAASDGRKDQERVEKTDRRRTEDDVARMNKTFGAGTAVLERPDNRVFSDQHRLQVEAEVKQALTAAMPREVRPSTMYVPKLNRTDLITDERGAALISTPGNVVHSGVPDPAGIVSVKSTHTNRETHIYPGESAAARRAKIRWTFGMKQTSEEKVAVRASRYAPMPEKHAEQFSEPDGLDALLGELLRFSEYDGKLPAVDIFQAGTYRGTNYTPAHLDQMIANWKRHSSGDKPRLPVPLVLGHREDQDILRRSDLPAAGWVERLYRQGDKLKADFSGVPRKFRDLVQRKAYRRTSAEIYPNPQAAGLDGSGMMLRRVGALGADLPELKTLDDFPTDEPYSEQFASYETILQRFCELNPGNPECLLCCFSEVESMDETQAPGSREDMLAKLQEHGVDGGALEGCPDGALAEMLRVLDDRSESPEEEPEEEERPEEMDDTPEEMEEEPRRVEEPVEEEPGEEEYPDEEEEPATPPRKKFGAGCGDRKPMPFSEKARKALARIVATEVKKAVRAETSGSLKRAQKFHEDYEASERTKTVDAFLESRQLQHKILPYELDAADPANLRNRLLRANGKTVVAKFSEDGKEIELTDLELQMREIDRRPAFQFGEQFKDPADAAGAGSEKAKVERHFETYRESMTRVGLTKENLVKAFEIRQKQEPDLTADRFLNVTTRTS